jgi:3-oxoacyl-ACP reductase-like protein
MRICARAALRAKRLAQLEELNRAAPALALANGGQPLMLTHMGEVEEAVSTIKMHRVADGVVELGGEEEEQAAERGEGRRLNIPVNCYTCKRPFRDLHFFYDQLCPACAALNYQKRNEMANLTKRVALVTGARVKIGYRIALKLLRCGATVIATSRFAADCARRYAAEKGTLPSPLFPISPPWALVTRLDHLTPGAVVRASACAYREHTR